VQARRHRNHPTQAPEGQQQRQVCPEAQQGVTPGEARQASAQAEQPQDDIEQKNALESEQINTPESLAGPAVLMDQGRMRLLAPPETTGSLINMPSELLVPIAGAQWTRATNVLQLLQPLADAAKLQRELLHLHTQLYNATGKLYWWSNHHPARLVETSSEIGASLERLKPGHQTQRYYAQTPRDF
jgi:hypothetical protein